MSSFEDMLMTLGQENEDVNFQPQGSNPNLMAALTGQAQAGGVTQPASQTGLPPRSPVDTSMLGPLMLLNMAAQVSRRRQYGQSKTNQVLEGISGAANYGMNLKQQMQEEDRRKRKSELDDVVTGSNLRGAELNQQATKQQMDQRAELHPLVVAGQQAGLDRAQIQAKLAEKELETYDELYALKVESLRNKNREDAAMFQVREGKLQNQLREISNAQRALQLQGTANKLDVAGEKLQLEREKREQALPRELSKGDPEMGGGSFTYRKEGKDFVYYNPLTQVGALEQAKADLRSRGKGDFTPEMLQARAAELMKPRLLELTKDGPKWVDDKEAVTLGPTARPATASTAGQPTNQLAPTEPEFTKMLDRLKGLPAGSVISHKGAHYVLGADKKSIQTATKEQINFNGSAPTTTTGAPATSQQDDSAGLSPSFVEKLKKFPDVELPGPDGKSYVYYSGTKQIKSTGSVKPYRRLFEPE